MAEEPLEVPLRHAATDRVGGERVLGALVGRDVVQPQALDGVVPDVLEILRCRQARRRTFDWGEDA